MPRGGPRPNSGRKKGSKNRSTIEREDRARIEYLNRQTRQDQVDERIADEAASIVSEAKQDGERLGKEILHQFANLFADLATHYRPQLVTVQQPDGSATIVLRGGDEAKFRQYGQLAMQAAKDVAVFQSPRLSAVMLGGPVETHFVVTGGIPDDQDGSLIDARPNGTIELDAPVGDGVAGPVPGPAAGADQPADVPEQ